MKKFWMVYVEGQSQPGFQHPSLEEAKKEAERLCTKLRVRAYVLEALGACALKAIEWDVLEPP